MPTQEPIKEEVKETPKKSNDALVMKIAIIAIILALILGVGLGFLLANYQNKNTEKTTQTTTTSTITTTATSTSTPSGTVTSTISVGTNPYAGWNTFTNVKYAYTFKYPADKYIGKFNFTEDKEYVVFVGSKTQMDSINNLIGGIDGLTKIGDLSVAISVNDGYVPTSDPSFEVKTANIKIGGLDAVQYTIKMIKEPGGPTGGLSLGEQYREVKLKKGNVYYNFTYFSANNDYTLQEKILSSFVFN